MSFSITDAAFEGFRIARERPKAVLIWAGAYLVATIAIISAMISILGADATFFVSHQDQVATLSQADAMRMLSVMGRLYGMLFPLVLVLLSIMACAVYRIVLRPDDRGLGYLRFGADELRIIALWALLAALSFGLTMVAMVVTALADAAAGAATAGGQLIAILTPLLLLCAIAWMWVRLSLAGPMTFAGRRVRIVEAWRMTRGRFWSLLGCYALALSFCAIVVVLGFVIAVCLSAVAGGGLAGIEQALRPDFTSLAAYFSPARGIYLVVASMIAALQCAIILAPPAVVYRDLADASDAPGPGSPWR